MGVSPERETESLPVLHEQLCFALYTATHRIIRAYRPLLEPLGLTYVQYLVMLVLWESAPRSVGEVRPRPVGGVPRSSWCDIRCVILPFTLSPTRPTA